MPGQSGANGGGVIILYKKKEEKNQNTARKQREASRWCSSQPKHIIATAPPPPPPIHLRKTALKPRRNVATCLDVPASDRGVDDGVLEKLHRVVAAVRVAPVVRRPKERIALRKATRLQVLMSKAGKTGGGGGESG